MLLLMRLFYVMIGLSFALGLSACGGASNEPPTTQPPPVSRLQTILDGDMTVEFIKHDGTAQLAATNTGLYWRASVNHTWQLRSPSNTKITGIAIIGPGHYILAAQPAEATNAPFPLYESTDSGASWQAITHNFGGTEFTPLFNLAYDARTDQLYALGQGALAVANRDATDWRLLQGGWDIFASGMRLLLIDPIHTSVWYGGQGAIENGYFGRYNQQTGDLQEWENLLAPPAVFLAGIVHPLDTDTIILSGENGIVRSTDAGDTWRAVLDDANHSFFWDIVADAAGTLYTARYDKLQPSQPLIILCSNDSGASWKQNDWSSDSSLGGVKSLLIAHHGQQPMLYLGLWAGGIKALPISALSCAN